MTFAQIRAQFITLSGRADFTDSAGDGCEFFIKAGHKLLERMVSSPRAIIEDEVDTVASRRWVLSDSYRAIKEVWVKDSTQGDVPWVKLDRITYSDYLNAYNSDTDTNMAGTVWQTATELAHADANIATVRDSQTHNNESNLSTSDVFLLTVSDTSTDKLQLACDDISGSDREEWDARGKLTITKIT